MSKGNKVLLTILIYIVSIPALIFGNYKFANAFSSENLYKGFDGDSSKSGVIDENGLFNNDKESLDDLNKLVRECSEELKMNIIIYLPDSSRSSYSDDRVRDFTGRTYVDMFGRYTDGLLYYIDISGKRPACDDIAKSGKANLIYDDDVCQSIFKVLDKHLPSSSQTVYPDHIKNGVNSFCNQLKKYDSDFSPTKIKYFHAKGGSEKDDPDVYVYMKGDEYRITESKAIGLKFIILTVSELIGFLTALITYLLVKRHYKFKSAANPSVYVARERSNLTDRSDVLVRSYVTKHKIEKSSGGGGGFSGGSFGGGIGHSSHHR